MQAGGMPGGDDGFIQEPRAYRGTKLAHCTYIGCPMHRPHTHTLTHKHAIMQRAEEEAEERKREEAGLIVDDKQSRTRLSNLPLGLCSC